MRQVEEVIRDASLDELLTLQELAATLGVSYVRAAAIVQELDLPARYATVEEEQQLQGTISQVTGEPRVKGLPPKQPGARIKLVLRDAVPKARGRRGPGWPWGKARKGKGGPG
jgi:hypothetical protein